jgi:hypothetical protein
LPEINAIAPLLQKTTIFCLFFVQVRDKGAAVLLLTGSEGLFFSNFRAFEPSAQFLSNTQLVVPVPPHTAAAQTKLRLAEGNNR